MTITIQKWGNSQGIRIPKHYLNELSWSEDEMVDLFIEDGKIIIERSRPKKKKNIVELFEGFKGEYEPVEFIWDAPEGREVW